VDSGATLSLKARGNVEIDAGGRLVMQGRTGVAISSPGPTEVEGTPVKLN
jgi:hypothetical protein